MSKCSTTNNNLYAEISADLCQKLPEIDRKKIENKSNVAFFLLFCMFFGQFEMKLRKFESSESSRRNTQLSSATWKGKSCIFLVEQNIGLTKVKKSPKVSKA